MSKIFISYSHDSPEHAARVLALADQLIQDGLDCVLDQYVGDPPEGCPQWMDREIKAAEYVLMICTETYYQRVMGEEKPGKGLGVRWEGRLIYQHIYQAEANNPKFIPVLFEADHVRFIPTPLQGGTFYTLDSEDGYEKLYWRLTGQYKVEKPTPGQIKKRPPHERKPLFEKTSQPGGVRLSSEKIFLAKLPTTGGELYGRENELKLLDDAWNDPQTHIFTFVAWGGVGKTALVNHWLNRIEHDNYRGAERVYGWTFYSQGAREGSQASADEFFAHARKWFGDPDPTQGSPWDKGVRLAGLIRQQRTLLILDGLEPLQYPAGEPGKLKDQGVQALLKELCRANPGLCLITTRLAIKDLAHVEMVVACSPSADPGCHCEERSDEAISTGSGSESAPRDCFAALAMTPFTKSRTAKRPCRRMYLEQLAPAAGAQLLDNLGVKGTLAERQQASQEFKGHALALNLLGRYLAVVHDGEIRKRDLIPHLTEEEEQGGHARRVMESYEKWLQGTPELDILYIMGLFDRPAPQAAIEALLKNSTIKSLLRRPAIKGLTDNIHHLSDAQWKYALKRLRDLRLLAEEEERTPFALSLSKGNRGSTGSPRTGILDCHPLVREHFGAKLRQENPAAWQAAHSRLYEYYKNLPKKKYPDTLEEMEPLFAAVMHGCQAGRHQEALYEVYWERILRKKEKYTIYKLGTFSSDLVALANFFETPWNQLAAELTVADKAMVLSWVGFRLRALGRLREAAQPMQAGLEARIRQKNGEEAAKDAGNLSELYLMLGDLPQAVTYARQSVDFADRSGDAFLRQTSRAWLADSQYQVGELLESKRLFREVEAIQQERWPEYPYLYSLQGFQFCDLLLSQGAYQEVHTRAAQTLKWVTQQNWLLDIALDNLSLGRALLLQAQAENSPPRAPSLFQKRGAGGRVFAYLHQAVEGLREAGTQDHLPRGLLARAEFFRLVGEFAHAWDDLAEAREIAEWGEMGLWLADYHLEAARLINEELRIKNEELKEGHSRQQAKEHLAKAEALIAQMGYHRRDNEVAELKAQLQDTRD